MNHYKDAGEMFSDEALEAQQQAMEEQIMADGEKIHQAQIIISNTLTKADIAPLTDLLVNDVLSSGEPLAVVENIKVMELIIEAVKGDKRFKDYALSELAKYGKKFTSDRGVVIEPMEAGTKYFYDKCNDSKMSALLDDKERLDIMIKDREKFLKALPASGLEMVDKETGEAYLIYPPYKTSTTSYKVTVK